jgi:hypothetical protein
VKHPVSERHAALYHVLIALVTVGAVFYHLEAARRHWEAR